METPFIFGKLVTGKEFTNREEELRRLKNNFRSGINSIVISPRRWGKSSLVEKAVQEVISENPRIKTLFIDLFNVRTEEDFYRILAEETIRATTSKATEILHAAKTFFKQWIPRVSFSPDHLQEFSLGLNWSEIAKQPDEILDLPQTVAQAREVQLIICIDEFQNIGFFSEPLGFQKRLRAHWQRQPQVSYCLYGSKRHMLLNVFTSPSMPFYKFGDLMFLEKIQPAAWESFIVGRFAATGKVISPELAREIALSVENHPYYVQQLSQVCWLRTSRSMSREILVQSLESLILQLSLLFQNLTENLSNPQVSFLRALLNEESRLSSAETISRYSLGSSANVARLRQALIHKEIIDQTTGTLEFLDPVYKLWLKRIYFKG